jgi:hypothetical protein
MKALVFVAQFIRIYRKLRDFFNQERRNEKENEKIPQNSGKIQDPVLRLRT